MNIDPETRDRAVFFLQQNTIAVVATVDSRGQPEAATVSYFADAALNFYFVTRKQSRKFANLLSNKHIAVVIGTQKGPSTLQCEGQAEFLEHEDDVQKFMSNLSDKKALQAVYSGDDKGAVFSKIPGSDYAIFRVKLNWMRWMDYDLKTGREAYYQII